MSGVLFRLRLSIRLRKASVGSTMADRKGQAHGLLYQPSDGMLAIRGLYPGTRRTRTCPNLSRISKYQHGAGWPVHIQADELLGVFTADIQGRHSIKRRRIAEKKIPELKTARECIAGGEKMCWSRNCQRVTLPGSQQAQSFCIHRFCPVRSATEPQQARVSDSGMSLFP